ncbi:MAG TPA: bacillithiol biosynthesis deacetylase BshB1 [Terriglobia bacterium]|jgi:bacillithiol biosynthesis deacetylase BshB1|nr:bacillithiol biosynthesis deacetylase BshB1 [Terriglobia bacterium]
MDLDILAIAAHPDDVELTCGGTVIRMVEAGYRVGILDLSAGESGTRGSPSLRQKESSRASRVMGIVHRANLGLPDAGIEDVREHKLLIAQKIRELHPRTVILPYWEGRHPDHYTAGQIGYEACFLAGLVKLRLEGRPHRPHKIIYASLYVPSIRPSFVVDISTQFEKKLKSILCYGSQFSPRKDVHNLFPSRSDLRERVGSLARHFGLMIGVRYGEPFMMREVPAVDDIVAMPVRSI